MPSCRVLSSCYWPESFHRNLCRSCHSSSYAWPLCCYCSWPSDFTGAGESGDYAENNPFNAYDFPEPYLRAIFGFVGITNVHFVNAQPMDVTPEIREAAVRSFRVADKKTSALQKLLLLGRD